MKINIALIGPEEGLGGGNRKYRIYFKYLDDDLFNKYYIKISDTISETKNEEVYLKEQSLLDFINEKNIHYVYLSGDFKKFITPKTYIGIKKKAVILKNVNFTEVYDADEKVLNLVISKTDHLKIKLIHNTLVNDYVVYNPIDFELWNKLSKNKKNNYKLFFENKKIKYVIGRLARAEPSKWDFLILKTLLLLQKHKNYQYGFVFAGTSWIYRCAMTLLLDKKMKKSILFLPELKENEDLAKFYNTIDLFWQASHIGESFGNVIAESFSFKVPVITDFKKFLREDGTVSKEKYDAQIELVDHNENGAYCNYPDCVISFLDKNTKQSLKKLGKNGYQKVKKHYDAKIAGMTLAKILYAHLRKNKKVPKTQKFEKLSRIPSEKETEDYYEEYLKRINTAVKNNPITQQDLFKYNRQKKIWTIVENIYLLIRKILRVFGIDPEKIHLKK